MFSPEYYSKLDPSYREALRKFESELERFPYDRNASIDFAGKYMFPQQLWNLRFYQHGHYYHNSLADLAVYSFCYNNSCKKVYGLDHEDLMFPHKNLEQTMDEYERKSYSFIQPKIRQRHEEMKVLYLKIKEVEGDLDEWFAALMEAKDHDFVCDNVEYQLDKDLTDKKLWKKYIDYLKKHDFKILLETYSKYCRFFTDDFEMMEDYHRTAVKYNCHVSVPWKNPFRFEVYDAAFWKNRNKGSNKIQNVLHEIELLDIFFDADTAAKQKLPFKIEMLEHIIDNANGDVLQKLFKTCKWFNASMPVNVCYKFFETDYEDNDINRDEPLKYVEQSIKSFNHAFFETNNSELFISTIFDFRSNNALLRLIPRIYRYTAKYVRIENQNLSLEDLQFFIKHAVELHLENVRNLDGQEFTLESILQLTPKIKRIIYDVLVTNESIQKVIDFQYKFESIYFYNVNLDLLDPVKFAEFVTKSCSYDAKIILYVESMINLDAFRNVFKKARFEKWTGDEERMPSVCFL